MKETIIRFGTPKSVAFRETMGTALFDEELFARAYGTVRVHGYDTERYKDEEELTRSVKGCMPELIASSLKVLSQRSVMRGNTNRRIAGELQKELAERGIEAEVEVLGFVLDEGSQKKFEEMQKEVVTAAINEMNVDKTDRPYSKPDCVPMLPFVGPQQTGMPVALKRDRFCRQCGSRLCPADKFCRDCGAKVTVAFSSADPAAKAAPKSPPSDQGLTMLIDCCRKVMATALGDGHDETVLYLDESSGQYQIHTYAKTPGCPERHQAYLTDESTYRRVLEKIRENGIVDLAGGAYNGMCGGEYVVKFVIDGMSTRVSTANVPGDQMNRLYEVGAVLNGCIDREKEIAGE